MQFQENLNQIESTLLVRQIVNSSDCAATQQIDVRERSIHCKTNSWNQMENLWKEVESAVSATCKQKLIKLYWKKNALELSLLNCVLIAARELPPPTIGASSVYVMLRHDRKLYVGRTDDLVGQVCAHRLKEGMQNAAFLYFVVPAKSIACELDTLHINQLPNRGFQLTKLVIWLIHFGSSSHFLESIALLR